MVENLTAVCCMKEDEVETVKHFFLDCSAFTISRFKHLGAYNF